MHERRRVQSANTRLLLRWLAAEVAEEKTKKSERKEKRKAAFGWDVFNQVRSLLRL